MGFIRSRSLASEAEIWHRLGQELDAAAGRDEWLEAAGMTYRVEKVPAIASLNSDAFNHLGA